MSGRCPEPGIGADAAEAAQHIAAIRGLHGDLGDALGDEDETLQIWARIVAAQAQLVGVLRPLASADDE